MINDNHPHFADLFAQLGLDNSDAAIASFINENKGLAPEVHIEEAPFWNDSQKSFIAFELEEDAEWAELIDQLNSALR